VKIASVDERGVRILSCRGELKYGGPEEELLRACDDALAAGARRLVLDIRRLAWIDSSGVGALVACGRHVEDKAAVLKVVLPTEGPVRRVFVVSHLDRALEVFDDLDAAVKSFGS
jgi:anti-sigma B factor antagonist